ncbi:hypothetical protein CYMTET_17049, partial [Cymbomonas tetramitiformis]
HDTSVRSGSQVAEARCTASSVSTSANAKTASHVPVHHLSLLSSGLALQLGAHIQQCPKGADGELRLLWEGHSYPLALVD